MGVTFEEGETSASMLERPPQVSGLTSLFIKLGLGSTPAGAQKAMAVFAALLLGGSGFLFVTTRPAKPTVTPEEREELLIELRRGADGKTRAL